MCLFSVDYGSTPTARPCPSPCKRRATSANLGNNLKKTGIISKKIKGLESLLACFLLSVRNSAIERMLFCWL